MQSKRVSKSGGGRSGEPLKKTDAPPGFQGIESAWRGLDMLLRRIEDDASVRVYVGCNPGRAGPDVQAKRKGWADSELASFYYPWGVKVPAYRSLMPFWRII